MVIPGDNMLCRGHCYEPSSPYRIKARLVCILCIMLRSVPCARWSSARPSVSDFFFVAKAKPRIESVHFGDLMIASLLFADGIVLLASSSCDLQHILDQFSVKCEAAGMRISTFKSKAMVLCQKMVE